MFDKNPQVHFCSAGYGFNDGQAIVYGTTEVSSSGSGKQKQSVPSFSAEAKSVSYGTTIPVLDLDKKSSYRYEDSTKALSNLSVQASANTLYGEGSSEKKRPHLDTEEPRVSGGVSGLQNPQFQAGEKDSKKSQKKVRKRTDPQPLVDMMNDVTGSYDKPISVQQILKQNKIDMSWMDWIA